MSHSASAPALILELPPLATLSDAESSLMRIAVSDAAERHWARAKDATKLFEAIQAKLAEQAAYVVWRQDVMQQGDRTDLLQIGNKLPAADPGAVVVHRWRKRLCLKAKDHWQTDPAKIQQALDDAHRRSVRICEQEKDGTIRGTEGTGEFERYTPAEYIAAVREVLGEIDLDPASSALAQETVRAIEHFTVDDDGLAQEWHGRVFLNPPYHRDRPQLELELDEPPKSRSSAA